MNKLDFIKHQATIKTGRVVRVKRAGSYEFHLSINQRVFVVLNGDEEFIKAQLSVMAQLNRIMHNVRA